MRTSSRSISVTRWPPISSSWTAPQSLAAVGIKLRSLLAAEAPLAGFDREIDLVRQCVGFLEGETAATQDGPAPSEPEVIGFGEPEPRP
jgi:hypothetical protein